MYQELRAKYKKLSRYSGLIFAVILLHIIIIVTTLVKRVDFTALHPNEYQRMIMLILRIISWITILITWVCAIGTLVWSNKIINFIKRKKKTELYPYKGVATTGKTGSIIQIVCLSIQLLINILIVFLPEEYLTIYARTIVSISFYLMIALLIAGIIQIVVFSYSIVYDKILVDKKEVFNVYDYRSTNSSSINGQTPITTEVTPDTN